MSQPTEGVQVLTERHTHKVAKANAAIKKLLSRKGCARTTRRLLRWDRQLWRRYGIASSWRNKPWTVEVAQSGRNLIIENFSTPGSRVSEGDVWTPPNLQPYQVRIFMHEGSLNLHQRR